VRRGRRKGQRREGKVSYAAELRDVLWTAGVRREDCPLQVDTAKTRRVDMHSLRRAWTDAAGQAGVNAQTSMRLTGHSNIETHQRYLSRSEILSVPQHDPCRFAFVRFWF
jgi:hypothetical protein